MTSTTIPLVAARRMQDEMRLSLLGEISISLDRLQRSLMQSTRSKCDIAVNSLLRLPCPRLLPNLLDQ